MEDLIVFQDDKEIERLRVQNKLLSSYERPALDAIFGNCAKRCEDGEKMAVLDIGCNDGEKTVSIFSYNSISNVVGLEYNKKLAQKAQKEFGNDKFFFSTLDVESDDFSESLSKIMKEKGIKAFDCIYLSFVLMHLKNPQKLLMTLHGLLKEEGALVIVEANDCVSSLSGDNDHLLAIFLDILNRDKYSGNRSLGASVEQMAKACGYEDVHIWCDAVSAGYGEQAKKQAIVTTFFSYLEEDVDILLKEEDCEEYRKWKDWLTCHLPKLESLILKEDSEISMGMKIISCDKGFCSKRFCKKG